MIVVYIGSGTAGGLYSSTGVGIIGVGCTYSVGSGYLPKAIYLLIIMITLVIIWFPISITEVKMKLCNTTTVSMVELILS